MVDHGLGIQAAVSAPQIVSSHPFTRVDSRIAAEVCPERERRGHILEVVAGRAGAGAGGVLVDGDVLRGGEDPVGDSAAAGC